MSPFDRALTRSAVRGLLEHHDGLDLADLQRQVDEAIHVVHARTGPLQRRVVDGEHRQSALGLEPHAVEQGAHQPELADRAAVEHLSRHGGGVDAGVVIRRQMSKVRADTPRA